MPSPGGQATASVWSLGGQRSSSEMTGGAFSVFEESAPLLDTSRHVHLNEDEMY
jgi:hypothetical protein